MDKEFTPKYSQRHDKYRAVETLIIASIKSKLQEEPEAKENIEGWIEYNTGFINDYLYYNAVGRYEQNLATDPPEDLIQYVIDMRDKISELINGKLTAKSYRSPEELKDYKNRIEEKIKAYPKEAEAYKKAYEMLQNNYSERAILATVKKILE